jgi:Domain of unknown function (DUF4166)
VATTVVDQRVESPFQHVLSKHADALPEVFRTQYMTSLVDGDAIVLTGEMESVWRRGRWLWPAFWAMSLIGALFTEVGVNIKTSLTITSSIGPGTKTEQLWRRKFEFKSTRYIESKAKFHPQTGRIIESSGWGGLLWTEWDIEFRPPVTLLYLPAKAGIAIGQMRIAVPGLLMPRFRGVQTATGPNSTRIEVALNHPWLGDIFGYVGHFNLSTEGGAP